MPRYIVKLTQTEGQTRLTIPKLLAVESGLRKAQVVEVWYTEDKIISIKEYKGAEDQDRDT